VIDALEQTRRDFRGILAILPDISAANLRVTTLVALPTVSRHHPAVTGLTGATDASILYREDFNPKCADKGSIAERLCQDIIDQSTIQPGGLLATRLGLATIQAPTTEVLAMYRTVAARYIGLGSLHPVKTPREFFVKMIKELQNIDKAASDPMRAPKALHLDPSQVAAITARTS